jgi:flagellar assembly protein FliH
MSPGPKNGFRNVPPPPGGKPTATYARFIPREELGEVESWKPGAFAGNAGSGAGAGGSGVGAAGGTGPAGAAPVSDPTPEELRERLAAERVALRQAGYQDGYRDGLAALENFKQHFASQATAQIGALLESFDRQLHALDARVADTLLRCTVQLARQVVRSELAQRPELVARVASDAVHAVMLSARHISVRAHPADLPLIETGAEEALAARGARLVADETIARGGVLVESDAGSVDARIAVRWAQAAALLGSDEPWSAEEGA